MSLQIRPATPLDAGRLGGILTDWTDATAWLPRLHSAAQDIAHAAQMIERGWVTVAQSAAGTIAGFLARDDGYVHALFVSGTHRGEGVGTALIRDAQSRAPRLELWTHQANDAARAFYAQLGFEETGRTSGLHNDESLPDIGFHWTRKAMA
ncbi:GNAT family N-acetyltransferase [Pseudoprimorskyibacter insulae]|uniref:Putative N-acetyltransferase YjaB n=1 Tax=Pseudoprimorskyibacter insulae TaxID=1695997 RepID=A0A2R8AVA3_9RHOB|nr:GNAT family N-acetyltransferase [Pseudoprimorskyibacter insulae]SPF79956.1 putative N-acetyltransferase YjaB [Pseudoprimorskyibacter insulae]